MPKRMIGIFLDNDERAALLALAQNERRGARDQAAILIREKLIERGLLPIESPTPVNASTALPSEAAHVQR